MSDRPAQKPAFCPYIYHDGVDIFLEFDSVVLRFTKSEGGLSKALQHIPNVSRQPGFLTGGQNIADRILSKPKAPKSVKVSRRTLLDREAKARAAKLSDRLKSRVATIVRKMG